MRQTNSFEAFGRRTGEHRVHLDRVAYTGSGNTAGTREVRFVYEVRPDPVTHYGQFAYGTAFDQRLSRITTTVDGSPVKTYRLQYRDTGESLIEQVRECAGSGDAGCKPPTTFTYGANEGFAHGDRSGYFPTPSAMLDVNGDGIVDVLHITATRRVTDHPLTASKLLYDIGGYVVGAAVGMYTNSMAAGMAAGAAYNTAGAFIFPDDVKVSFQRDLGLSTPQDPDFTHERIEDPAGLDGTGQYPAILVDWDLDGRDDVIVARPLRVGSIDDVLGYRLELHRSNGGGSFSPRTDLLVYVADSDTAPLIYDVDGDGLPDVVHCVGDNGVHDTEHVEVLRRSSPTQELSDVQPWRVEGSISDIYCRMNPKYTVFDIDGDGVQNLVIHRGGGRWSSLERHGPAEPVWRDDVIAQGDYVAEYGPATRIGDFNGDGLPDAFATNGNMFNLWLNRGGWLSVGQTPRSSYGTKFRAYALVDYDGNGRVDVLENWMDSNEGYVNVVDSFKADSYGNVTSHATVLRDHSLDPVETVTVTATYSPDPDTWLISNPDSVVTTATRAGTSGSVVRRQSFEYTASGLLFTTTRSTAGSSSYQHTEYGRDGFGNVTSITTSEGTGELARTTTIAYDDEGLYPVTVANPLGQLTQVRFDERWGAMSAVVDPNGVAQQSSYDAYGRVYETRGPNGSSITTLAPATAGFFNDGPVSGQPVVAVTTDVTGAQGESGGGSTVELDYLGRPIRRTSSGFAGAAVVEATAYDGASRVTARTLPRASAEDRGWEHHTYDALGRLTGKERSDADAVPGMGLGVFSTVEYIAGRRLDAGFAHWLAGLSEVESAEVVVTTDPQNRRNVTIHDSYGRVTRTIDGASLDAGGLVSSYGYDLAGRLESIVSVDGTTRTYAYDAYGRLSSTSDPNSGSRAYTYDGFDQVKATTTAEGQTTMTYDQLGRVTTVAAPDGASSWQYDVGVNAVGKLIRSISPPSERSPLGVAVEYEYEPVVANNRGSLSATTVLVEDKALRTEVSYDGLGRPTTVQYPGLGAGTPVIASYSYDASSGALRSVAEIGGAAPRPLWELEEAYEGMAVGRERYGNGAQSSYTYDEHTRQVTSIGTVLSGAVVQALEYTYYVNGQVEARTDTEYGQDHYWYDEVGRLAVHEKRDAAGGFLDRRGFDYHPNGNIATYQGRGHDELTYSTTRPQHVVGAGSHLAHEYDELGRVIERSGEDVAGLVQQIAYRSFDLPSRITTGAGPEPIVTEYEYTAGAARVSEHNGRRAHYLVGDAYEAVTSDVTGELEEEHFRIFAGGRAIAEVTRDAAGADRVEYLHADALGSTDAISGESGESVRQGWEAFGTWDAERSDPPMSGLETRVGFTGQMDDHGTGLINMKGRLYDPLVGRFMTPDPVVQAPFWSQGHNQYSYVFNDPANLVDPSGYSGEWAYSEAAVGVGIWGGALMGGTALGAASLSGLISGSGAAGGVAGTGLGKMLAGMIGPSSGTRAISPVMPSTAAKGAGAPAGGAGAKGQQGAPGGGVGGAAGQWLSKGGVGAYAANIPPVQPGTMNPDEVIVDPIVRREIRRAIADSNPTTGASPGPDVREQGGWIIERTDPAEVASLGRYYVQRWPDEKAVYNHIPIPPTPTDVKVAGSFHVHPCYGDNWPSAASGDDWRQFGDMGAPHYVFDGGYIFRLYDFRYEMISSPGVWRFLGPAGVALGAGAAYWAAGDRAR